jgi:16S rRNA (adenine(1408)-N(1))-methyltransferase
VTIDLGTGDGRSVLGAARADPARLVIGIDADAASMRSAATRALRRKTAVPNAIFVVAAVERLPDELAGIADRITVHFPWGSLLRGFVTGADEVLGPIGDVAAPGADLTALWSIEPRDAATVGVIPPPPDAIVRSFDRHGLDVKEIRPASVEEIRATGSTWAKRLGAGTARTVTLLRAMKR